MAIGGGGGGRSRLAKLLWKLQALRRIGLGFRVSGLGFRDVLLRSEVQ